MASSGVKFAWYGASVIRRIEAAAKNGVGAAAKVIVDESRQLILRGGRKRSISSAVKAVAGGPPVSRTGELILSFKIKVTGTTAEIINDAPHAKWLELGTRKAAPHPFMRPALLSGKDKAIAAAAKPFTATLAKP